MATNAPVPGDSTVPSAPAERRRARWGDAEGIVLYAVAVGVIAVMILAMVMLA